MFRSAIVFMLATSSVAAASPNVVIEAEYPAAGVQVIAETILAPLEVHLKDTPGVTHVRSVALDGHGYVRLDLAAQADPFKVRAAALERIALVQRQLPVGVRLRMLPLTADSFVLIGLRPDAKTDLRAVSTLARDVVVPHLKRVPLVADVQVAGDQQDYLRVALDPVKLQARNLSPSDIMAALREANVQFPAGIIGKPPMQPKKAPAVEGIEIIRGNGKEVFLKDVGTIGIRTRSHGSAGVAVPDERKAAGGPAVILIVQMLPDGVKSVPKELDKALADLANKIPAGVQVNKHVLAPDDTTVVLTCPDGTSLDRRADSARTSAFAALTSEHVRAAFWIAKAGESDARVYLASNTGKMTALRADLRERLKLRDAALRITGLTSPLLPWPGDGMQIVARVSGADLDQLRKSADVLREKLAAVKGVVDVDHGPAMRTFMAVQIDREKCAQLGVRIGDVADALQFAIVDKHLSDFNLFGRSVSVILADDDKRREPRNVKVRTPKGELVPLFDLAKITNELAPASILRHDGVACVIVACNVHGRDVDDARKEVIRLAKELSRKNVRIEVGE